MDHIWYKHDLDKPKKCLSVGYSGVLSVVVVIICVLAPAYISSYRCLEYLLEVRYIILIDPNRDGFMICETTFVSRLATLPYVWRIYHKN